VNKEARVLLNSTNDNNLKGARTFFSELYDNAYVVIEFHVFGIINMPVLV
jgi:hypothetical protein